MNSPCKSSFHLAQLNIGRLKEPLDHPMMQEFTDFLEPVNQLAENSRGFIWRLKDETGLSSSYVDSPFDDKSLLVNFSMWQDIESLRSFTYKTVHSYFLKNRARWFDKMSSHHMVLWWEPEGTIPGLDKAVEKLELLREKGPSKEAFTFSKVFDPD